MLRSTGAAQPDVAGRTRRERSAVERRGRTRRRTLAVVAVVAVAATALPSAAVARGTATAPLPGVTVVDDLPSRPVAEGRSVGVLATVEDADAWCDYLSSYYLSFPSPWSARVINCRSSHLFVAPVYSDGSLGMCALVPARHSRHLGGNVARWVTDIRLC